MFDNPYFNLYFATQELRKPEVISAINNPFTYSNEESILPQEALTGGRVMEGDILGDSRLRRTPLTRDQRANVYSQAITGGLQLATDAMTIANQPLGIGEAPAPIYMEGFDPTYQTGDYAARAFGATPQGASAGEILGTAGKGAATGASIGTTIGGPVGTLIGAGVGAVAGALSAGIGGGVRKRRQTREKERALSQVQSQQEQFNRAQAAFNEQQAAQFGYQQRRNRRMQNLFI